MFVTGLVVVILASSGGRWSVGSIGRECGVGRFLTAADRGTVRCPDVIPSAVAFVISGPDGTLV